MPLKPNLLEYKDHIYKNLSHIYHFGVTFLTNKNKITFMQSWKDNENIAQVRKEIGKPDTNSAENDKQETRNGQIDINQGEFFEKVSQPLMHGLISLKGSLEGFLDDSIDKKKSIDELLLNINNLIKYTIVINIKLQDSNENKLYRAEDINEDLKNKLEKLKETMKSFHEYLGSSEIKNFVFDEDDKKASQNLKIDAIKISFICSLISGDKSKSYETAVFLSNELLSENGAVDKIMDDLKNFMNNLKSYKDSGNKKEIFTKLEAIKTRTVFAFREGSENEGPDAANKQHSP